VRRWLHLSAQSDEAVLSPSRDAPQVTAEEAKLKLEEQKLHVLHSCEGDAEAARKLHDSAQKALRHARQVTCSM
jgi:hypothetical protein